MSHGTGTRVRVCSGVARVRGSSVHTSEPRYQACPRSSAAAGPDPDGVVSRYRGGRSAQLDDPDGDLGGCKAELHPC